METTTKIPSPADLTNEATAYGIPLRFEWEDQRAEEYQPHYAAREYVIMRDYQAYADGVAYGVWAKISEEPSKLPHEFYVVFAEDAAETNGKAYGTLDEALGYIEYLIESN